MACEEESKAAPQRETVASGRLLTFAYEYASHPKLRLETCDASEETMRSAFDSIGFDTSPNYPVGPAGMKKTVKNAAAALKSGDVLAVYYFGHGVVHADTQYLETEGGVVCIQCLCNIVIEAVVENGVSGVTFLLMLDCCRTNEKVSKEPKPGKSEDLSDHRTHTNPRDDSVFTDATRLGITVSYSTCPGTKRRHALVQTLSHHPACSGLRSYAGLRVSWFAKAWARVVRDPEPLSTLLDRVCEAVTDSTDAQITSANQRLGPTNVVLRTCAPPESPFPSVRNSEVPQHVVGIDTMVATLQKAFFEDPSKRGVLLRGAPGSGKSTIARAYVASHNDNGTDASYPGGVIWLSGNTRAAIAKRIGQEMRRFAPPASAEEVVPWFRDWLDNQPRRWLVVVDDVGNGSGVEGGGDGVADSLLKWLGELLPGRSRGGGHVLVTSCATRLSEWVESLTVVLAPPLTQDQSVLALWRYIRRRVPANPREGDRGFLSLPHADGMAAQVASSPTRDDLVPAGVLDPHLQVEWDQIPERVAALWAWDCGEQRRDEGISTCIQCLAPGLPNLALMAQSQRITLLQWYTRLLLVRPEVTVDQQLQELQDLQPALRSKLYAWACLLASEAAGDPSHPCAIEQSYLFSAVRETVRRLCGVIADEALRVSAPHRHSLEHGRAPGDQAADKPLAELLPLKSHDEEEHASLLTLAEELLAMPGSGGRPSVLLQAADALLDGGYCIASFLAAYKRDPTLVASATGVGTGGGGGVTGAGSGGGDAGHAAEGTTRPGGIVDGDISGALPAVRVRASIDPVNSASGGAGSEESGEDGWVQVSRIANQGDAPNKDGETDSEEDDEAGGACNTRDDINRDGDNSDGGAGGTGSGIGHGTGNVNAGHGQSKGTTSNGTSSGSPSGRSRGGRSDTVCAKDSAVCDASTGPVLIAGPTWPPRGMRIVALHGQRDDGQASAATKFAAVAAPHYVGGVFVLEGQSTTAMWKGIRGVVLAKALCSTTEGAALDDITVCDVFLKWLADVRSPCLFVVTNARVVENSGCDPSDVVEVADDDSDDDVVASRCGAMPWLLSRLRNTSNLHVLFTTTVPRAATASVAPVVATISLGSFGAHHAGAVMKLLASAYSLPSCPTEPVDSAGSTTANMEAQATHRRRDTAQRTAASGREAFHGGSDARIVAGMPPSVVHEVQQCATTGVGVSQPPSAGAGGGKAACASVANQSGIGHPSPVPPPATRDAEASVTRACDGCQSEQAARMAEDTARQRTEIGAQRGDAVAPCTSSGGKPATASFGADAALPHNPNGYILSYGASYKSASALNEVPQCPPSAAAVHDAFVSECGFSPTFPPTLDEDVTCRRMIEDVRRVAATMASHDVVVLFFTGHGSRMDDTTCLVDSVGSHVSVRKLQAVFAEAVEARELRDVSFVAILDCAQTTSSGEFCPMRLVVVFCRRCGNCLSAVSTVQGWLTQVIVVMISTWMQASAPGLWELQRVPVRGVEIRTYDVKLTVR